MSEKYNAASVDEVVTYLRQRAAILTELGESWEDIEYHKAQGYFTQAGVFEEAADCLESKGKE